MNDHLRYVILLSKVEGKELTRELIRQHVDHLTALDREGRLVLCGPFTDHPSGMVIIRAMNTREASGIADSDPFVRNGVRTYEVRTWTIACRENNYLAEDDGVPKESLS